jgi:hypothetical protein
MFSCSVLLRDSVPLSDGLLLPSSLLTRPVASPLRVVVPVYELPRPVTCVEGMEMIEERSEPSCCNATPVGSAWRYAPDSLAGCRPSCPLTSVTCSMFPFFSSPTTKTGTEPRDIDPATSSYFGGGRCSPLTSRSTLKRGR